MIVLWVVLAVVVVLVFTSASFVTVTRGRRRHQKELSDGGVALKEAPPGAPPTAPFRAPPPPVTEAPPTPEAPAVPEAPPTPEAPPAPPRWRDRLGKARGVFSPLRAIRTRSALEAAVWDDLEEALLRADVGVTTTDALLGDLRRRVQQKEVSGGEELVDALRADLVQLLGESGDRSLHADADAGAVNVWLFVGVNGVGKTTTIGKLARQQVLAGRSVLLAAGDTFRAAAGEQLTTWSERSGAGIVLGTEGGDPGAVVYDAVQRAAARGEDLVLADTAGRLHTKVNLVEELKKIRRVADRAPGHVQEVLLVLDATTGQNGLVQARQFTEAVAVTGVVLTKLDGTAKGGVVLAIQRELGLPVKLVGLGEGPDDLVPFEPEQFVDALLN